jgi:hypothetical protein
MKIVIDIAHPAHIHYFRNLSNKLTSRGHRCLFTIRNKGIIKELADYYKLDYKIRSQERKNKIFYALEAIFNIFKIAREFKPDLFLDMGTVFASPVAWLMKKPYIAFDDTEVSTKARLFHMPFTDIIFTPSCFYIDLGRKQIRFESYMELFYLHPTLFSPNDEVLQKNSLVKGHYVVMRFVSWEAHHDIGQAGIKNSTKLDLINLIKKMNMKIIISSEAELPKEFEPYKMRIETFNIHHLMAGAALVITEGATMASESVLLGTPAIYINSIQNGYIRSLAKAGLLLSLKEDSRLLENLNNIFQSINDGTLLNFKEKVKEHVSSKINPTNFIVWFIENYPQSVMTMKDDPEYQMRFK